jgi:hypothetical protein
MPANVINFKIEGINCKYVNLSYHAEEKTCLKSIKIKVIEDNIINEMITLNGFQNLVIKALHFYTVNI